MADHHDRRIKDLISNREFAISFMQQYMASELVVLVDWATFELDTASVEHVRQQHKNNVKQKELSDLAFSFKFKDGRNGAALVHIEYQTSDDITILIRTRHYQTSYLLDYIKRNKDVKKLPLIVSVIYYTNKQPFSYSLDINDYFQNKELAEKYAFKMEFVDLVRQPDSEILAHGYISGLEFVLKHIMQRDIDGQIGIAAKTMLGYDSFARQTLIKYMSDYSDLDFNQFYDKIISSSSDLQGDVMTVSQQIAERALQEHAPMLKAEGKAEGAHEKALATARKLLQLGDTVEKVVIATDLSKEEVNALADEVNGSKH